MSFFGGIGAPSFTSAGEALSGFLVVVSGFFGASSAVEGEASPTGCDALNAAPPIGASGNQPR